MLCLVLVKFCPDQHPLHTVAPQALFKGCFHADLVDDCVEHSSYSSSAVGSLVGIQRRLQASIDFEDGFDEFPNEANEVFEELPALLRSATGTATAKLQACCKQVAAIKS